MTQQEQIVDGIIADYLETKFSGVKDKLSKTSKYFKRGAKASILGTDRKMYELIKTLEEKNSECNYLTYFDELVNAYREYVEVADCEVKTHGEVMTPIWLVEDMLNTLPSDVWSNPNLKWLDPCSGVGTYSSVVVQRLMKGLEDFEKNPTKRYRHIIEEMIYVCELQPKNMFIFQCVFDKDDTNELNTYCGSFLDENFDKHMTDEWGVEKFDIVMGNPPYQTQKEGNRKTQPIWHLFVEKSISILTDGGYLNMVHPSGWREVDGIFKETQKLIVTKQILSLRMHNYQDGLKTFGCKVSYDYYTLKNINNDGFITDVTCVDGSLIKIDLMDNEFLPDENIYEIYSLVAKDNEEKVNILYSRSLYGTDKENMNKEKTEQFRYPCINAVSSLNIPSCYYSKINTNGHFNVPKVIFSNVASGVITDENGNYGLTQFAYGIVDEVQNLADIQKALCNEKFIKKIMLYRNYGFKYNRKVIATFRKDFYKQFLND
jgi:hypothetical protein